jgi:hypothetical protein
VTPSDFAHAVLARLGLPESANNVAALVAFQANEGGHMANAAAYNPINTTLKLPGSHPVTPVGVQAYSSWDQGIEATARTLAQSNMSAITAALKRSAPPDETLRAVAGSPWGCTICSKTPAASLQHYADKLFPIGKGMLDTGESTLKELFAFRSTASKVGGAVVAASLLAGLGVVGYLLVRKVKRVEVTPS